MKIYIIKEGRYSGLIGRILDRMGPLNVLLVQSQDQWMLAYENDDNLRQIIYWELQGIHIREITI